MMIVQTIFTDGEYEGFVTVFNNNEIQVYSIGIIHYFQNTSIFGYYTSKIDDGSTTVKTWNNPDQSKVEKYVKKCTRII